MPTYRGNIKGFIHPDIDRSEPPVREEPVCVCDRCGRTVPESGFRPKRQHGISVRSKTCLSCEDEHRRLYYADANARQRGHEHTYAVYDGDEMVEMGTSAELVERLIRCKDCDNFDALELDDWNCC